MWCGLLSYYSCFLCFHGIFLCIQEYNCTPCWAFHVIRWYLVYLGMVMIIHVLPIMLWWVIVKISNIQFCTNIILMIHISGGFMGESELVICFFSYFFISVPCARLNWPSRQLFSAYKYTVSYRIVRRIVSYECRLSSGWPPTPNQVNQLGRWVRQWRLLASTSTVTIYYYSVW